MNTNFTAIDDTTLALMKIVERAVRPLRAPKTRKRKIRSELLAHLSTTYEEELSRCNDSLLAQQAAVRRFGNPAELTEELQKTVPRHEQWEASLELLFGWRPPESEIRWMLRAAIQTSFLMAIAYFFTAYLAVREFGLSNSVWLTLRPFAASVIAMGPIIAFSGICYFKMRDNLLGAFGSQKSVTRTVVWAALLTASTLVLGLIFKAVATGSLSSVAIILYPWTTACIIWSTGVLAFARIFGPQEIRDAQWLLLNLDDLQLAD